MNEVGSPIVPWIGGKRRLAKEIIPLFPEHTCYVEVFCGGAALYFLRPAPAKVEIINDINGELINLYRVVQHHLDEFVRQFRWALTSRQEFLRLQDIPANTLTDIQRAARFYYLQQHAFGGKVSGQNFGTSTTGRAINLLRIEERLSAGHLRLAGGTIIENLHWRDCLARYDREHTFFYLDPPYWGVAGYGMPFEWSEYEALATAMRSMKGRALLSINDHPDIRRCFREFPMRDVQIRYSLGSKERPPKKSGELIIANFAL